MRKDDIYPSKYLKAGDLPEEGTQAATIERVTVEEVGLKKDKKAVIHFSNLDKSFIVNKTNFGTIVKATGSEDTDGWIGKTIQLYRAEVEFQGDMVESIRVKLRTSAATGKQQVDDDEIEF